MTNSTKIKISLFVISVLVIFTIFFVNRIIISNVRIDSRIQVEKIAVAYSEVIHKEDMVEVVSKMFPLSVHKYS